MASIKASEVRSWGDQELSDHLAEAKQELFNLRFQVVTGQLDNYARIADVRHDIARMHGEIRTRQLSSIEES